MQKQELLQLLSIELLQALVSLRHLSLLRDFSLWCKCPAWASIVHVLTAEHGELFLRGNDLKRRLPVDKEEERLPWIENTAVAERVIAVDLKNTYLRAGMKSLHQMVEDTSDTESDRKRKKRSYILTARSHEYRDSASKPPALGPKYYAC